MKNNQLLEELLNLSGEINQAIYEAAYGIPNNPNKKAYEEDPSGYIKRGVEAKKAADADPYGYKATQKVLDARNARQKAYTGSVKSYVDDVKREVPERIAPLIAKAGELTDKVKNHVSGHAKNIVADPKRWASREWKNTKYEAGLAASKVTDLAKAAYNDPKGYVAANKGALAGGAAGVAALGVGVYAAKKMAQHKRWIKNGCDSIVDAGEKLKCKNYVASKKK